AAGGAGTGEAAVTADSRGSAPRPGPWSVFRPDGAAALTLTMLAIAGFRTVFAGWGFAAVGAGGALLGLGVAGLAIRLGLRALGIASLALTAFTLAAGPVVL